MKKLFKRALTLVNAATILVIFLLANKAMAADCGVMVNHVDDIFQNRIVNKLTKEESLVLAQRISSDDIEVSMYEGIVEMVYDAEFIIGLQDEDVKDAIKEDVLFNCAMTN